MLALVGIISALFFILWLFNSDSSSSSSSSTRTDTYTPIIYNEPTTQISSQPRTISVSPTKIGSNPDLKISLIDGQYRYFENHYVNGRQYTFGFPKENCPDKRVWVGIGNEEIERISLTEAKRRIENGYYSSGQTQRLSASTNDTGYCTVCNKKLRGNIYKKKCFECYTRGTVVNKGVGYCSNCSKKLRGNIYKKHCTECYHNGHR
jgi:hypothetical protein